MLEQYEYTSGMGISATATALSLPTPGIFITGFFCRSGQQIRRHNNTMLPYSLRNHCSIKGSRKASSSRNRLSMRMVQSSETLIAVSRRVTIMR